MKQRPKIFRSASVLFGGEIFIQIAGLLRNIIIARMISPEDYGIAATLAMSVSLVEMFSDLGAGRFLTRQVLEDETSWLSVAHSLALVRGALGGGVIYLSAPALARLLNMGEVTWAFQAIAIVPLIRSVTHHGIWTAQRRFRYGSLVLYQTVPQALAVLAAYPLSHWLPDFRCMLVIIVGMNLAYAVVSHLTSDERYRISFDGPKIGVVTRYGLPLMVDGALMFLIMHGERVLIANQFTTRDLGVYSAALLLTAAPAGAVGRLGLSLGVPYVGKRMSAHEVFLYGSLASAFIAIAYAAFFGLTSGFLAGAIFGPGYETGSTFVALLAATYAVRILRTPAIVISLAAGTTTQLAIANIIRALGLLGGFVLAKQTGRPEALVVGGLCFEFFALVWHLHALSITKMRNVLAGIGIAAVCILIAMSQLLLQF